MSANSETYGTRKSNDAIDIDGRASGASVTPAPLVIVVSPPGGNGLGGNSNKCAETVNLVVMIPPALCSFIVITCDCAVAATCAPRTRAKKNLRVDGDNITPPCASILCTTLALSSACKPETTRCCDVTLMCENECVACPATSTVWSI